MYCNHCGKPNEENATVCTSCGLEIQRTEDAKIPQAQKPSKIDVDGIGNKISELGSNIDTDKIKSKLDGIDKKKLATYGGIAGGALAVIIALIIVVTAFTSKVSLKKYMADELTYSGINGYGTADTSDLIDFESLNQVVLKNNFSENDYYEYYYGSRNIQEYLSYECTSENNGKLSNGDEVEIVVTINKDGIKNNKMFKKGISGGETQKFKFKVEGLTDGTAIDVFDAVESVEYDTTSSYYSNTTIKLKENYVREYNTNGINVKVENNYIKVYGDDFNSFSIGLSIASDNYDENSTTIKLKTSAEADEYKDYGIVLSEVEKDVPATIIKCAKDNKFTQEDLNALNAREKKFAAEKFQGEKVTLTKATLFVYNQTPVSRLVYFYKNQEGKFYVIYYDKLKVTNTGRIYNIDEIELDIDGWWGYATYDSIDAYKQQAIVYDTEFDIAVS